MKPTDITTKNEEAELIAERGPLSVVASCMRPGGYWATVIALPKTEAEGRAAVEGASFPTDHPEVARDGEITLYETFYKTVARKTRTAFRRIMTRAVVL